MTFKFNCDPEILEVIEREASSQGISKANYVREIILSTSKLPITLSVGGTRLDEINAYALLLNDGLIPTIHRLAQENRRDIVRQILYLAEIGLRCVDQPKESSNSNIVAFKQKQK